MYIPKIGDYLRTLTDNKVKDSAVTNYDILNL